MNSKIIQISTTSVVANNQIHYLTTALCEDGTVWRQYDGKGLWKPATMPGSTDSIKLIQLRAAVVELQSAAYLSGGAAFDAVIDKIDELLKGD